MKYFSEDNRSLDQDSNWVLTDIKQQCKDRYSKKIMDPQNDSSCPKIIFKSITASLGESITRYIIRPFSDTTWDCKFQKFEELFESTFTHKLCENENVR